MNPLRQFPRFLLNDVPERHPKYLYLSLLVIVPILTASIGVLLWLATSAPWWIALLAGIAGLAIGFLTVLRLVDRILPKKLPVDKDML